MFTVCKQTVPATGIEFAIKCKFFNNLEDNLVIGGANILKVFRIIPEVELNSKEKFSEHRPPNMRMECMASYELFGNIMSLQSVSLNNSQRDALLISFKEAKLSVVQHDPDHYDLKTLSLHYFEEEDVKGGWTGNHNIPIVRVDPDNRCAVMLVYGKKLVVLPFRKDNTLDEIEIQDVKPIKKTPMQLIAKTPILPSYLITLKDLDEKIDNVIDIQFLQGYYEPTLLILYEPVRTFPGRIAVRNDTCCLVAISLNIQQRVHPVIWSVTNLPFDALQAVPINKPIGGCLILCINSLIYLNQSVPSYGVSLNSTADHSTNFPLRPQDGVKISLDAAQIAFISNDKLVLSLKDGELYVLSLVADSMRSVRSFHFSRAASSVITSCVCLMHDEYLFLGSRLGNSLLLRFKEKEDNTIITIDDTDTPTVDKDLQMSKRMRLEEEELLVYGSKATKTAVQLSSYIFEVCDSLMNLSPIGYMAVGERARADEHLDDEEEDDKRDITKMELEVVASVGHGKNGAICVLHNTLRPKILTSFELNGCLDLWTVIDDSQMRRETKHTFMILTQRKTSMVLKTSEEITDIHNTGFACNTPTIFVGNLGSNRYIVQVTSKSIRLLQGTRLVQNIPIELGYPLTNVSIADPYICVRASNGQVVTLALRDNRENTSQRLYMNRNRISGTAACISIYRDTSGMFTTSCDDYADLTKTASGSRDFGGYMKAEPGKEIEDEEDLLYGETGSKFKMQSMIDMQAATNAQKSDWWRRFLQSVKPSYWLFVIRENGNLEIYSVPDLKLMYMITEVGNGNKVLTDAMEFVPLSQPEDENGETSQRIDQSSDLLPREILMLGMGYNGTRPILFIRMRNDLFIYRTFRYIQGNLKVRFRRMRHSIIYSSVDQQIKDEPENYDENEDEFSINPANTQKLRHFSNINGMSGVCICGNRRSYFVYLTIKGELRTHQFNDDSITINSGSMRCFAEFNNANCPNGFLYFNISDDNLKISVFPEQFIVDADTPMHKTVLRSTPQHIIYHPDVKVYGVVLNSKDVSNKYFRFNGEDKELLEDNRGERFLYPTVDKFTFVLVSPSNWQIVPEIQMDLEDWEHVCGLKMVMLAYEGAQSGFKGYICMVTNFNYSEDITSRGRILLFDLIEVVPEPDKPWTKYKLKQIYAKEQKGPVSAVTSTMGLLVAAVGQKVYLWQLKDGDLTGVAFIDTNIFIHQMVSIKCLILVADVYKSVTVLRYQEQFRTLSIVSRDFNPLMVYQIEYIVDREILAFLASDAEANLSIFMYQPESRESFGGQKLIRKADYHLGQRVNAMFRVACNFKQQYDKKITAYDNKHMTFFSTLDGGFGFILPLPEKTYRRLFMLQNVLLTHSAHLCGLNPKAFRTIKQWRKSLTNPGRSVLDGELIWQYMHLNHSEKNEIAKKIGTKIDEIYQDLYEIDTVSRVF
ncbi:hypothetical protein PVAND_002358 [Polypedilum vanderplanki]|uniref:Cleavage and polyadenylation specificity factor subunit 1 n=1 Tax=Polypedilum vanderplanki TaxID=319348 RepID=A0A9J6BR79_POLVA|nr:hypothetical protein PVAND_002358 [Polypedilum vanderplanki]